jgi:hypothetical protein
MAYGTNKKKSAVKKPAPKKSNPLYYKDKSGTVRFSSNKKPVATGRADQPMFDPVDAAGFTMGVAKNAPTIAKGLSKGINLSKVTTKSKLVNKGVAKIAGPIIASTLSGGDNDNKKSTSVSKKFTSKYKSKSKKSK